MALMNENKIAASENGQITVYKCSSTLGLNFIV